MLGTILSFCFMAVAARELSGNIGVFEILFFRSTFGLIIVSGIIFLTGNTALFHTNRIHIHGVRNIFHLAGQSGWVLGIGLLPLAEVFALEFTVPIWVALIASLFLNESITKVKAIAILLGFLGVVVIVKPGFASYDTTSLIVLGAAIAYAIAHVTNKSLTGTEAPITILFFMCLMQLPIAFLLSLNHWIWPIGIEWFWLSVIGLTALIGHYCLSRAMSLAEVGVIMTIDFLRLPLIAIMAMFLYSESFDLAMVLGSAMILAGNLLNLNAQRGSKGAPT